MKRKTAKLVRPRAIRDRIAYRLILMAMRMCSPWYRHILRGAIKFGVPNNIPNPRYHRVPESPA